MNIIVTGTNGFIGHHVAAYLREKGNYVVGIGRKENSLFDCDEYVQCDLSTDKVSNLSELIKVSNIDAVVHLAADMRHEPYEVEVVEHNCVGVQRLLEWCEANGVKAFVQLSSLPVIGLPVEHPITESHPIKPPTVYHTTKYMQERLADYACYKHNLRTVSLRICSPIGPGDNPKTIFPTFVRNAVNGKDIVLYGKGTRKQTYIHVKDIAQAIYKSICSEAQGVYNLASYNLISNYDLAKKCIDVLGSDSKVIFSENEDPLDNVVWDISIEKLKNDTGFEPVIDLDFAIKEYADYISSSEKG